MFSCTYRSVLTSSWSWSNRALQVEGSGDSQPLGGKQKRPCGLGLSRASVLLPVAVLRRALKCKRQRLPADVHHHCYGNQSPQFQPLPGRRALNAAEGLRGDNKHTPNNSRPPSNWNGRRYDTCTPDVQSNRTRRQTHTPGRLCLTTKAHSSQRNFRPQWRKPLGLRQSHDVGLVGPGVVQVSSLSCVYLFFLIIKLKMSGNVRSVASDLRQPK